MKKYLTYLIIFCTTFYYTVADANSMLVPASFPKTNADTTFVERLENKTKGYEPYMGLSAYQIIKFESMEDVALQAIEQELIKDSLDNHTDPTTNIVAPQAIEQELIKDSFDNHTAPTTNIDKTHNIGIFYRASFFGAGIKEMCRLWLERDCIVSPEEMAKLLLDEYKNRDC